jgi:MFS family permease
LRWDTSLVVAVPGGFLGQRFGDKRMVLLGIALMAAGGLLSGVAGTYEPLLTGRVVSGVGATFLFVLVNKMVTDWFTGSALFFGMSIFVVGWPVGIASGQATQALAAGLWSWQTVFVGAAVLMVVAFVFMAALYRSPPSAAATARGSAARLDRHEVWFVCIAGAVWMLINGAYLVLLTFGPTLLTERGASVAGAAVVVSSMSWVFVVGLPLGGWLAAGTLLLIGFFRFEQRRLAPPRAMTPSIAAVDPR